jgi:type II secretory pathway component PulC
MNVKRLLLLINLCLAGLVLWMASSIYLTWRSAGEEKGRTQTRPAESGSRAKTASGKPKTLKDYQIIIDRDIFDTAKEAPSIKEEKIAKVTKLDLKLRGTVIGGRRNSFAIIEDGITRKEELYSPNDFVQGARIVDILPDQVILDLKGVKETLMMTEDTGPASSVKRRKTRAKAPRTKPRRIKRPKRPKI